MKLRRVCIWGAWVCWRRGNVSRATRQDIINSEWVLTCPLLITTKKHGFGVDILGSSTNQDTSHHQDYDMFWDHTVCSKSSDVRRTSHVIQHVFLRPKMMPYSMGAPLGLSLHLEFRDQSDTYLYVTYTYVCPYYRMRWGTGLVSMVRQVIITNFKLNSMSWLFFWPCGLSGSIF